MSKVLCGLVATACGAGLLVAVRRTVRDPLGDWTLAIPKRDKNERTPEFHAYVAMGAIVGVLVTLLGLFMLTSGIPDLGR